MAQPQSFGLGSKEIEASLKKIKPGKKMDKISDYEKLTLKTIEDNRKRIEALGLNRIENSLVDSVPNQAKKMSNKKGKAKVLDSVDVEYMLSDEEENHGLSSKKCAPDDSDAYKVASWWNPF